jgi:AcrR family transcriptional regulator
MLLFWEQGYEGTSMADLTQATGLNPSSIYAAFGDKHALFSLSVKRYMEIRAQYARKARPRPRPSSARARIGCIATRSLCRSRFALGKNV